MPPGNTVHMDESPFVMIATYLTTNVFREYYFHAKDVTYHWPFSPHGEPQAFQAIVESQQVIMENCIRCHTQLNTEFVKTGTQSFDMIKKIREKPIGLSLQQDVLR